MCGICGVIGEEDTHAAEEWLRAMNASIAHRGPDAEGIWSAPGIALGHRRLSIIDTSPAGNQPFFSADGSLALVFNGEIYNYLELRRELEGEFSFHSGSDTEVILAAYRRWGIEAIHRFIGMFAFALWDQRTRKGYLVRDRMGVKPVYYSAVNGRLFFASEVRALLATNQVRRTLDEAGLVDYLRYQTVHSPATILRDVHMLPAGHLAEFGSSQWSIREYWNPATAAGHASGLTRREHMAGVRDLMHSAVSIRMRADVPFGAFLSGGIDSSIIVGLMAGASSYPVDTFSVTFSEKEWDESAYSSLIARKFNTRHHPIPLKATDFLQDIPLALGAMDHPSGDGPNTYVVSRVTRAQGVKMALSGLGGDELFAGYDVFRRMKEMEAKSWLNLAPRSLRSFSAAALNRLKPSVASEKIAEVLRAAEVDWMSAYPVSRRVFLDARISDLLAIRTDVPNPVEQLTQRMSGAPLPLLSRISMLEMGTYMQNVLLRDADQMSMAHALEVRVPFLDHRLVEYVLRIPDDQKYPHTPKQLLTDAMGDLIPHEVVHRPKMGFTFPWEIWMKNELRAMCEGGMRYLDELPYFRPGRPMALWKGFLAGDRRITWSRIWPLVVLSSWMQTNHIR